MQWVLLLHGGGVRFGGEREGGFGRQRDVAVSVCSGSEEMIVLKRRYEGSSAPQLCERGKVGSRGIRSFNTGCPRHSTADLTQTPPQILYIIALYDSKFAVLRSSILTSMFSSEKPSVFAGCSMLTRRPSMMGI